MCGTLRSAG